MLLIFLSLALAAAKPAPWRFRWVNITRTCALGLAKAVPLTQVLQTVPKFRPYAADLARFEWRRVRAQSFVGVHRGPRQRAELLVSSHEGDVTFGFGLHLHVTRPSEEQSRFLDQLERGLGLGPADDPAGRLTRLVDRTLMARQSFVASFLLEPPPPLLDFELTPDVVESSDLGRLPRDLVEEVVAGRRLTLEGRIEITQTFFDVVRALTSD